MMYSSTSRTLRKVREATLSLGQVMMMKMDQHTTCSNRCFRLYMARLCMYLVSSLVYIGNVQPTWSVFVLGDAANRTMDFDWNSELTSLRTV